MYVNDLPPSVRYKSDNILVVLLSYITDNSKMDMSQLLKPFIQEMQNLEKDGIRITTRNYIYVPHLITCSVDLKAQPLLSKLMQYNGHHACINCKQEGTSVVVGNNQSSKQKRYLFEKNPPLRTNTETTLQMIEANKTKCVVDGIQGINPLALLDTFRPVDGFVIDYMHNMLLGVGRQIMNLYFSKAKKDADFQKNASDFKNQINDRLLSIKPPAFIKRKPRPIEMCARWKANEWRNWYLFYAIPCLKGLLPTEYLEHLTLFISSLHLLLRNSIDKRDIPKIKKNLLEFVKDFQKLFGHDQMTMNIHKLIHVSELVLNWGPLWVYSAFGFESKNGQIVKYVKGTTDVLAQISSKCVFKRYLAKKQNKTFYKSESTRFLGKEQHFFVSNPKIKRAFRNKCINNNSLQIYHRVLFKSIVYTSVHYKVAKKSIDYVIETSNGCIGEIQFFFERENEIFLLLSMFKTQKVNKNEEAFLKKVKILNEFEVFTIDDIKSKCVFIQIDSKNHYVYKYPNDFEGD